MSVLCNNIARPACHPQAQCALIQTWIKVAESEEEEKHPQLSIRCSLPFRVVGLEHQEKTRKLWQALSQGKTIITLQIDHVPDPVRVILMNRGNYSYLSFASELDLTLVSQSWGHVYRQRINDYKLIDDKLSDDYRLLEVPLTRKEVD